MGTSPLNVVSEGGHAARSLLEQVAIAELLEDSLARDGLPGHLRDTLPPGADPVALMGGHREALERTWHGHVDGAAFQVAEVIYTGRGNRPLTASQQTALMDATGTVSAARREGTPAAGPPPRGAQPAREGGDWAAQRIAELTRLREQGVVAPLVSEEWFEAEGRGAEQDGKVASDMVRVADETEIVTRLKAGESVASVYGEDTGSWLATEPKAATIKRHTRQAGSRKGAIKTMTKLGDAHRDVARREKAAALAESGQWYVRAFTRTTPLALPKPPAVESARESAHAAVQGMGSPAGASPGQRVPAVARGFVSDSPNSAAALAAKVGAALPQIAPNRVPPDAVREDIAAVTEAFMRGHSAGQSPGHSAQQEQRGGRGRDDGRGGVERVQGL